MKRIFTKQATFSIDEKMNNNVRDTGKNILKHQVFRKLVIQIISSLLLQPVTLVVAELCLTRILRFKTFDTRCTAYTKQRDPRRPSCYTQYSGTTLLVNQKKDHIYEWKKPKLLRRRRRRLNRRIHASIRSHSLTDHHRRPAHKRSIAIKRGAVRLGLKQRQHLMREQSGII